jgi:predicted phosphoribosyltransferase
MQLRSRTERFADRLDAGRALGKLVVDRLTARQAGGVLPADIIVLGLPRGGVPVAAEVARALAAPLDVLLVRKIGVPGHAELAMGAVAAVGGAVEVVTNEPVVHRLRIPPDAFQAVQRDELVELRRRTAVYRGDRPAPTLTGRTVVVVDDGLATGSTMRAAVAAVRRSSPAAVIVAVPVGATDTCERLRGEVDDVVCPLRPHPFYAVHQGYLDFRQTTDEEVLAALAGHNR